MDAEYYQGQDLEALSNLVNYQDWILSFFNPYLGGNVLEIGAGIGNISKGYLDKVSLLTLLEPSKNLFPILKNNLNEFEHISFSNNLLEDVFGIEKDEISFKVGSYDNIISVNVFEHIENDQETFHMCHELLRENGRLLLFVPAIKLLYGSLDKLVSHFRRYSKLDLISLTKNAGLVIEKCQYVDMVGTIPWFILGRIMKSRKFNKKQAEFYDSFFIPKLRKMESFINNPLFGKNLVLIAKKEVSK